MSSYIPLPVYEQFNIPVFSCDLAYIKGENGKYKKQMNANCNWVKGELQSYPNKPGYCALTGAKGGITAIDIDEPDGEVAKTLMGMMSNCNMIAETRQGRHYVFSYCDQLKTGMNSQYHIDTRNDGGCLYVEPSYYKTPEGNIVNYKWLLTPDMMGDETINPITDEALAYMKQFVPNLFKDYDTTTAKQKNTKTCLVDQDEPLIVASPKTYEDVVEKLASYITNNESYDDWLRNGMICFNEGLPIEVWMRMSRAVPGYESTPDSVYTAKWATFRNGGRKLTQASWWAWLKTNNRSAWAELMQERSDFIQKCENINHRDFAQYFYNIYPNAYVWNSTLNWYSLQANNTWKHCDKGHPHTLKNHIAQILQEIVLDTRKTVIEAMAKKRSNLTTSDDDKREDERIKKQEHHQLNVLVAAYKQFGNTNFISGIIDFLPTFYEVPELQEIMDTKRGIFAFTDCLVELETGLVRPIRADDWLSRTCGYAYPKQSNTETRNQIMRFIYNIVDDNETGKYLLNVFASALLGKNRFERFYVLTGSGGNGKGVIITLVHTAFGDYVITADTSLICKPQERRDQPCPALVDARDRLLMSFTEPEQSDKLQVGIIKKLTGGEDRVEARTLHSKNIVSYIPKYIPIVQANVLPRLSKIDGGAKRRLTVIHFPFQFVAEPEPGNATQKQGDPDIKDRLCKSEEWRNEFILMLIERAKTVGAMKSLNPPASVENATNDYMDDNNAIKEWLTTHYTLTKDQNDKIKASELLEQYVADTKQTMSAQAFAELIKYNGIERKKTKVCYEYIGIKRIVCAITDE